MPKVFISYSHDSPEHSERVLSVWPGRCNGIGIDVELRPVSRRGDRRLAPLVNEQSSRERSDFVVCVCTAEYTRPDRRQGAPGKGQRRLLGGQPPRRRHLRREKATGRLIPILFDEEPETSVPRFLRGWTYCRMREFALTDAGYEHLGSGSLPVRRRSRRTHLALGRYFRRSPHRTQGEHRVTGVHCR